MCVCVCIICCVCNFVYVYVQVYVLIHARVYVSFEEDWSLFFFSTSSISVSEQSQKAYYVRKVRRPGRLGSLNRGCKKSLQAKDLLEVVYWKEASSSSPFH